MKLTQKSKGAAALAAGLALLLLIPAPLLAVFGVEDTVEPGPIWTTSLISQYSMFGKIWAQDISTNLKLLEEIAQIEKVYANGVQMYNLGMAMSHSFEPGQRMQWVTIAQMGVADYTQDKYGENKGWASSVNGSPSGVPSAWKLATLDLNGGTYLAGQTLGQSPAMARFATVSEIDGSSQSCLQTISQYRGNSLANQLGPVLKLAIARADGSAASNAEIAQLNLLSAGQQQATTEMRAQGYINACMVEQQILANKMQRDEQVEELNRRETDSIYRSPLSVEDTAAAFASITDR